MSTQTSAATAPPTPAAQPSLLARARSVAGYLNLAAALIALAAVLVLHFSGSPALGRAVAVGFVVIVIFWTLVDMIRAVIRGEFGLDILAVVAMVATLAVGEHIASLIIVVMLLGGAVLEDPPRRARAQRAARPHAAHGAPRHVPR